MKERGPPLLVRDPGIANMVQGDAGSRGQQGAAITSHRRGTVGGEVNTVRVRDQADYYSITAAAVQPGS